LVENLTGQQKEFALAAQRSIIKLEHRVNELLDMSKGEVGLLELDYTEIDLNNFFDNLQPDLEAIVWRHKQHLILNIESNLPPIKGDTDRIQQVVFNLVDNALKFNPNNGSVIIKASQKSGEVVISVRDEGPGVEESNVPLLFEPYKGVKPAAQSMGGLGLGLPLSKMLVELHGGRIWFETQKDKGSLFSFSIPVISDNKENMAE
jgi:signal transduction histidine kinase